VLPRIGFVGQDKHKAHLDGRRASAPGPRDTGRELEGADTHSQCAGAPTADTHARKPKHAPARLATAAFIQPVCSGALLCRQITRSRSRLREEPPAAACIDVSQCSEVADLVRRMS